MGTSVPADQDVVFWDCKESEELTHTEIDEAIEDWLDSQHPTPIDELPVTVEVTGYVRRAPNPHGYVDDGGILERLLEQLDEEYGSRANRPSPTWSCRPSSACSLKR